MGFWFTHFRFLQRQQRFKSAVPAASFSNGTDRCARVANNLALAYLDIADINRWL